MKTIYEMQAAELRQIAKENNMVGAWKANKDQMIKFLESIGYQNQSGSAEEVTNEEPIVEETEAAPAEHFTKEKKQRGKDLITYKGKTQNLTQWANELGMPGQTLFARIHLSNWSVEKAFTTPVKKKNKKEG